ncbi:hypothetical protein Taro_036734 [Colocasia esculenta]|uniref:Secreted protein n=1 Tax=Colocasia esculenta TaxID=4460 RepID=A0A843WIP2_COLES|nr:hypothetical protein [Colocasia esculenta]
MFGLTWVVVEAFLCFRCFVVLCSRDSLSQEFVAGRSWWRFIAPCVASSVDSFPVGSECEMQECVAAVARCTCFERGCWFARAAFGFIVGLRVRVGESGASIPEEDIVRSNSECEE